MSYLPLARKWRPQTFAEVIGQEPVTTTLTHAITAKRLAHAYLFAGPRGVGKTSTARILAKCLNCAQGPTPTPCQQCDACRAITTGNSLDVLEIDGASNRGIDQIRELRENVKFLPNQGQYKIYIIDEVHQITADGFNALLKTLEEPPPHVLFIFATTHPEKVLPTILSRCQRFDFRRVPVRELVATLQRVAAQEGIRIDEPALFALARAADGSLRDAESLLDQVWNFTSGTVDLRVVTELLGCVGHEFVAKIVGALFARDAATALRLVDQLLQRGKDVSQISGTLVEHVRHLLVVKSLVPRTAEPQATLPWEELERLIEWPREAIQELLTAAEAMTSEDLLYMLQLLARAHETIKRSQHGRVHLELFLVKLARRADFTSLQALVDQWAREPQEPPSRPPEAAAPQKTVAPPVARVTDDPPPTPPASRATPPEPAQVAQASPTTPADASPLTLERVEQAWSQVIAEVGRQRMSIASCLAEGKPLEAAGERVIIGVPDKALHRELLEMPDHRRLIERALAAAIAVPRVAIIFRAVAVAEVPPPTAPHPEPHAADIVQSALKLFNAKVIEGHL